MVVCGGVWESVGVIVAYLVVDHDHEHDGESAKDVEGKDAGFGGRGGGLLLLFVLPVGRRQRPVDKQRRRLIACLQHPCEIRTAVECQVTP